MKSRLLTIAIIAFAIVAYWLAFRRPAPVIDAPTAAKLSVTCDQWCVEFLGKDVPESQWTDEVRQLDPKSVRASKDGIYIQRGSMFVESWGIFILKSDSKLDPLQGGDPTFRHLQGHVYWFEVKG